MKGFLIVILILNYVEFQSGNEVKKLQVHFISLPEDSVCGCDSWRYAANTLCCSLGMSVFILCTLFLWRYSTFGFTKGGLTWEAPSESDERHKVIFSNERSHILVLYAVLLYRLLLQRWYDYVLNAEENIVSFPNIILAFIWKRKYKRLNLKLETSNMKQNVDLIRRSVCLFTWLESWRGGRSVRWATNSQSHNHISTFY